MRNLKMMIPERIISGLIGRRIADVRYVHATRQMHKTATDAAAAAVATIRNIRNIGILAHIDAGKTTTTERMLFYAGKIRSLGEVHKGTTVTDYLEQERERGITICSAAVTFPWYNDLRINLIDTPGHIDFTMEVEQSLAAVDGVIVILDGSAGVEAQTVTVWSQSERHQLPRMVFVNKMDRPDADFEFCLADLRRKLNASVVPVQWPIYDEASGRLKGIVDLLRLTQLHWDDKSHGQSYTEQPVQDEELRLVATEKRNEIIDTISNFDDKLAERVITGGDNGYESVGDMELASALRAATLNQQLIPVFMGSAYKNMGIQPLLDGVCHYFPYPGERRPLAKSSSSREFVGKVFKVMHDKQRGPLSVVRILSGELKRNQKLVIGRDNKSEIVQRIYEPLADEYNEVSQMGAGNIAVCAGLKHTVTGDVVAGSASALKATTAAMESKNDGLRIPDAVYFCSIEPPTLSQQTVLDAALKQLQREDPSLRVRYDETTMQTVLGGMGELHLDIVKSRLLSEYKVNADLGPLQIAYKEMIDGEQEGEVEVAKEIAGMKQMVKIGVLLKTKADPEEETFKVDQSPQNPNLENLQLVRPKQLQLIRKGVVAALDRGPKLGGQVVNTKVILRNLTVGKGTADSFVMAVAGQCVQKVLLEADCRLLEPIMSLEIVTTENHLSRILGDLAKRRAQILEVTTRGENTKIVRVQAPLAELAKYSNTIRTLTSGNANLSMEPSSYEPMASQDEAKAIRRAQGLE